MTVHVYEPPPVNDWTQNDEWWRDPARAYLAGLVHGAQLESDRRDREDEEMWRDAVSAARRIIEVGEARDRAAGG
jgi:hypothetical protein